MFPGLTELHLIGCLIELIWIPKSKPNTSTPKTNFADIFDQRKFHAVMSGNHLLCLFNISHFSPTVSCAAMAKRSQQDSGEERVTAKSKPMMNLVARMPSFVSSSTSVSPVKRYYGKQDPWSSVVAKDGSGKFDSFSSTDYLKLDHDRAWSSQEWISEVTAHDRSGQPDKTSWRMVRQVRPDHEEILLDGTAQSVKNEELLRDRSGQPDDVKSPEEANSQNFIMGRDAKEFVIRVNDEVRKRQKRMSNVAGEGEEHSINCGMFMAGTMNAATFMGKNFQNNQNSIMNTSDLTLKKMFDISPKMVSEQDEIFKVDTIPWEKHSSKYLSLIGDETIINLQRVKVYVFSDSVLCLGRVHQYPKSNEAWKDRIGWITTDQSYRDYDGISGEPTEFEWNIFPGFTTLQLYGKVTDLLSNLRETPETFTGRILFMSMFNDISLDNKGNEEECLANAKVVSILAKKFWYRTMVIYWSQILRRSGILWKRIVHKEFGIISRKRCWWNSPKADVHFSVQRLHCPGVSSKAKDTENCRFTIVPTRQRLRLFFA